MSTTDQDWEKFGSTNPYYAVLTEKEFDTRNLDDASLTKFFASGSQHIHFILDTVKQHLVPSFQPKRALDFGCGVGRLIIPLAGICDAVVGVDVSDSMLREAKQNLAARNISNVSLVKSNDNLSLVEGQFDLVHSHIVLQHIPRARGEKIFLRLVNLVREGGVGVLHLTYLRKSSLLRRLFYWARSSNRFINGVANVRRGLPFNQPMMQMNEYRLNTLFQILHDNGCQHLHVDTTKDSYPGLDIHIYGIIIFFQKKHS